MVLHTSASSLVQYGDWTGGEIRFKTSGTKTFSIAPGKTLDTWLNFDADNIELKGDLRFRGMNLSDREIMADARIEIGSLSGNGTISGSGSSILATGGDFNANLGGKYASLTFSSGTTTLSGSYNVLNTTVLSGATVSLSQAYSANEADGITSATRLYGNLAVEQNAVVQAVTYNNSERGLFVSGNLSNGGNLQGGGACYWFAWGSCYGYGTSYLRLSVKGNVLNRSAGNI